MSEQSSSWRNRIMQADVGVTVKKLTAISLFSGIGGLDLAAAAAGFDIRAHVERDAWRRWILDCNKGYWPHAQAFDDIKTFGQAVFPSGANCDLIFGGFPCQDVSTAGKRAGLAKGTRSGLWSEFRRVIGGFRPQAVLVENVTGLLSQGAPQVVAEIAALGYDVQWGVISAADAGATHRRERVFIVAYRQQNGYDGARIEPRTGGHDPQRHNQVRESGQRRAELCAAVSSGVIGQHDGEHVVHTNEASCQKRLIAPNGLQKTEGLFRGTDCPNVVNTAQGTRKPSVITTISKEQPKLVFGEANQSHRRTRITTHARSERPLGRDADGLSARLDAWAGFAAPLGHPQHDYEPSRVVERGSQIFRTARLAALGDAVVPEQAFPILWYLYQRLVSER